MKIRPKEFVAPRVQVETYETLTAAQRAEEATAAEGGDEKAAPAESTEKENG